MNNEAKRILAILAGRYTFDIRSNAEAILDELFKMGFDGKIDTYYSIVDLVGNIAAYHAINIRKEEDGKYHVTEKLLFGQNETNVKNMSVICTNDITLDVCSGLPEILNSIWERYYNESHNDKI